MSDGHMNGFAKVGNCNTCETHSMLLATIAERTEKTAQAALHTEAMAETLKGMRQDHFQERVDDRKQKRLDRAIILMCAGAVCISMLMQQAGRSNTNLSLKTPSGSMAITQAEAQSK